MNLEGKVVLVTGGSRGIGSSIVQRFLQEGAKVESWSASGKEIQNVDLSSVKDRVSFRQVDLSSSEQIEKASNDFLDKYGCIDIIVNNAGITRDGLLMRMPEHDWDDVLTVNLKAVYLCLKQFIRPMIKNKGGRVINIASVSGILGTPGQANYAAAKAGVIGLTKTVAREYASRGILVNAVAPGFVDTDMTGELKDEYKNQVKQEIPLKRFGQVQEIANAVVFLASNQASYITGQVLSVDGGLSM